MDTSTAPATGVSQHQAAEQIASLLSVDDGTQDTGEADTTEEGDPSAGDTQEVPEDDGGEADDSDTGSEDAEEEQDDEPEQELPDDAKVKIGDEEVTLHELKRGFLREADYTRKTQALAEERRQHAAQAQTELEGLRSERAQFVQSLDEVQQFLAQLKPQEPDWNALYHEDPAQYAAQREMWRSWQEQQAQLAAARAAAVQQSQEDFQRELRTFVAGEAKKLLEKLPEWSKPEVARAEKQRIIQWGEANGFSSDEMAQLTDHRAVLTARKAMLYDEMMAKKASMKPIPAAKGQPRTAKPGTAATAPNRATDATRAKQRLAKTGKVKDAAEAILHFLPE